MMMMMINSGRGHMTRRGRFTRRVTQRSSIAVDSTWGPFHLPSPGHQRSFKVVQGHFRDHLLLLLLSLHLLLLLLLVVMVMTLNYVVSIIVDRRHYLTHRPPVCLRRHLV